MTVPAFPLYGPQSYAAEPYVPRPLSCTVVNENDSCLPWAASALFGALMGGATWSLTVWARAYCDAGYDAGGRLELNFLLPVIVVAGAAAGLASWSIGRRLAGGAWLPTLSVAAVTIGLAWWFFAARGTLADYPGDSGLCPASNIPPQWPNWIPA
ncbi:hypothetical protein GCM10017776_07990 [Streptomyces griseoluteus]|nr:hypothetical protein GCM10017776_07990 [Streptomyces griseoluteus]